MSKEQEEHRDRDRDEHGVNRWRFVHESGMDKEAFRMEAELRLLKLIHMEEFKEFSKTHASSKDIGEMAMKHSLEELRMAQQASALKVGFSLL